MAEPKYYDELPTYIMHSDGEFANGTFRALDGSGHKFDVRFQQNMSIGGEYLFFETEAHSARFISAFTDNSRDDFVFKDGMFNIKIDDVDYTVQPVYARFGGSILDRVDINVRDGRTTPAGVLSMRLTSKDYIDAQDNIIKNSIPANIKDGTGTGGVISGVANGDNVCEASGENSFAGGSGSTASGNCSVAFGEGSTASSDMSAAFNYAYAKAEAAFAANTGTASGEESFAVNYASAKGEASFACDNGVAVGDKSFAAGDHTAANGANTFCCGSSTIANGQSQTVIGKFNVEQGSVDASQPTDNAFIIGNGTGQNARSNALAVRWDGAIVLANGTVLTVEQLAKVANLT